MENFDEKYLYHYYEKSKGPFLNLSDFDIDMAQSVMDEIKANNDLMAAHRYDGYLKRRVYLEGMARELFIAKGGKPIRQVPHYMVIGRCDWLLTWYHEPEFIKIPIDSFPVSSISFSYGDLFPTFSDRVTDGREYRKQIYTLDEINLLIQKYGLPQQWNAGGEHGPERYIEAQIWDDEYLKGTSP